MIAELEIPKGLLEAVKKKLKEKAPEPDLNTNDEKTKEVTTKKGEKIVINPDITGNGNSPAGGNSSPDMAGNTRLSML